MVGPTEQTNLRQIGQLGSKDCMFNYNGGDILFFRFHLYSRIWFIPLSVMGSKRMATENRWTSLPAHTGKKDLYIEKMSL